MGGRPHPTLILASASPRRRDLLSQIGITPDDIYKTYVDETPMPNETARQMVLRLSTSKAMAATERYPQSFVLGADTCVTAGRIILGKATDEETARKHLELLSGRRHRVIGGICVIDPIGVVKTRVVETIVTFKRLEEMEITFYLETKEWHDKAGGYGIQGHAARFIKSINGSYHNVVGLSLFETSNLLTGMGYWPIQRDK